LFNVSVGDKQGGIEELGLKLIKEWVQEHKAELSRCGGTLEPQSYSRSSGVSGSESYVFAQGWRLPVDCLDVPWFQPTTKVVQLDGRTVTVTVDWETWERSWLKPLGIVKGVYINW
jgi:hypothetical protein